MSNLYVVIMAGGVGSRFWPYSRNSRPKQFLDVLNSGKSLLRMTFERFLEKTGKANIFVVTNQQYSDQVREDLPEISDHQILLEPQRRNTAPCIAYAAYKIKEKDPDAVMVVTPADHVILQESVFHRIIDISVKGALEENRLITIGIEPNRPETGYGYIQYEQNDSDVKKVRTFTEKPDVELARTFIKSGDFVWNAGIFVWSIKSIIEAFENCLPDIAETFQKGEGLYHTDKESGFIQSAYSLCKNISIDYGVMEKAPNVHVVLGDFGWSDLGSWDSLHEIREKDENQNVIEANALTYESNGNFIKAPEGKVVVVQGLEGYLVADFDDVLIVCKKDAESSIRQFVKDVKEKKGEQFI